MKKHLNRGIVAILLFLVLGTLFFHLFEGWSFVDAFYYSGVTMLTIGSSELTPSSSLTKIFTVIFAFSTIGIVLHSMTHIARERLEITKDLKKTLSKELKSLQKESELKSSKDNGVLKKKKKWLIFN